MFWELSMDDAAHSLTNAGATGLAANCDPVPRAGCDLPAKSALTVTHGKLTWNFQKGAVARSLADFGDPTTATTYTLCVYDGGARAWQAKIAPGPAWRPSGQSGFAYKAADGITRVALKAGAVGKPKVQVKGRGAVVASLATPVGEPVEVTVQLVNDTTPACWSDTYTTARTNVVGTLKAANR